jgi:hypothetical protein
MGWLVWGRRCLGFLWERIEVAVEEVKRGKVEIAFETGREGVVTTDNRICFFVPF